MADRIRVLVVGLGKMGTAHARVYHHLDDYDIVGLCSHHLAERGDLPAELADYRRFDEYHAALQALRPDAVSINTWPDTHAEYALAAFDAGAHVFVEKPLAETVQQAEQIIARAGEKKRKLIVGYILRQHPAWMHCVEITRTLGKPLVMRMNLNQQSDARAWRVHKNLMQSVSPLVDSGVHYLDMMCLITQAKPIKVHALGVRLSDEIAADMYNYGHLQVQFDDGSIGWYESGWGPMMSENASFIKDVIGPKGSVSMQVVKADSATDDSAQKTHTLQLHHAELNEAGAPVHQDEWFITQNEPNHAALCRREQEYLLRAIRDDINLDQHWHDALNSLKIVLAADASIRSGAVVYL